MNIPLSAKNPDAVIRRLSPILNLADAKDGGRIPLTAVPGTISGHIWRTAREICTREAASPNAHAVSGTHPRLIFFRRANLALVISDIPGAH